MSVFKTETISAEKVTDKQIYTMFYKELKHSVNEALWGNMHPLHRTIAAWRTNIAILPEKTRNELLQKIERSMGIQ